VRAAQQVNTSLQNPVSVGSWLRVEGEITAVDRRKVHVKASLVAPASEGQKEIVHCVADGLFIVKK
jgi:predicted thioesterase